MTYSSTKQPFTTLPAKLTTPNTSEALSDATLSQQSISVAASARLHLGFLDLNGDLGRHFGSIGLAVSSHQTRISLATDNTPATVPLNDATQQKIDKLAKQFYQSLGTNIQPEYHQSNFQIHSLIPEHAGLGSGTQLALVIGQLLASYHQLNVSPSQIAHAMGRGKRSGIGISTFSRGGFIVDAGLGAHSTTPASIVRHDFPAQWRLVVLMNKQQQGVHGQTEVEAFKTLAKFPLKYSQHICHLTLMQLLPALVEENIDLFGAAITEIQALIGQHFAPVQGGQYACQPIATLLQHAQSLGFGGVAQSSWGPTACIFTDSQSQADRLITALREVMATDTSLQDIELLSAAGVNQGADITIDNQTSINKP